MVWTVFGLSTRGEYEQATDRDGLVRYFMIERITDEKDYYGVHKRRLGPLRSISRESLSEQKSWIATRR